MEEVKDRASDQDEFVIQFCHASCEDSIRSSDIFGKLKKNVLPEWECRRSNTYWKYLLFGIGKRLWKPCGGVFWTQRLI